MKIVIFFLAFMGMLFGCNSPQKNVKRNIWRGIHKYTLLEVCSMCNMNNPTEDTVICAYIRPFIYKEPICFEDVWSNTTTIEEWGNCKTKLSILYCEGIFVDVYTEIPFFKDSSYNYFHNMLRAVSLDSFVFCTSSIQSVALNRKADSLLYETLIHLPLDRMCGKTTDKFFNYLPNLKYFEYLGCYPLDEGAKFALLTLSPNFNISIYFGKGKGREWNEINKLYFDAPEKEIIDSIQIHFYANSKTF